MDSWKNFNLKYKWMPSSCLINKFGLQKYDIDNFRRKENTRTLLDPWKISLSQKPDRLREIFEQAWEYCLRDDYNIDITAPRLKWIPKLLAVKNVSRSSSGFSFSTNSRYLKIICPKSFEDYRLHGFNNIALGAFHFWPGEVILKKNGVMPFMFSQTHKKAVDVICIEDMIEHVYLAFLLSKTAVISH